MQKVKPIIGRIGGKARLAPWIAKHLMQFQWSIYCEPFCGSAATFFHLINEGIPEQVLARGFHFRSVLNDADSRITKLFKTCRDHPELLAYAVAFTPYSREEHKLAQTGIDGLVDEVEEARQYLVDGWQSAAKAVGGGWAMARRTDRSTPEMIRAGGLTSDWQVWNGLAARILAASPHLQGDDIRREALMIAYALIELASSDSPEGKIADEIEKARRYLVDNWQGFAQKTGQEWGVELMTEKGGTFKTGGGVKNLQNVWHTLPARILAASPHLQGEPNPVDSLAYLNELGQRFCEPSVDVRVEMARRYLVNNQQSIGGDVGKSWGISKLTDRSTPEKIRAGGFNRLAEEWGDIPQRILAATDALKKCYIENDDAIKCMERWASPHTAFFCDPPYLDKSHYYAEKFNGEDHRRLAECANNIEAACVVISYYPDPLLDELYPVENWDRFYKETVASSAGITRNSKTRTRPKRTEMLLVRKSKNKVSVSFSGQLSLDLGI